MPEPDKRFAMVATLLRHELRQLLRDRRTVIFSILLPLVVMPLLLFSSLMVEERRERKLEQTTFSYAVLGDAAELARSLVGEGLALAEATAEGEEQPLRLMEQQVDDARAALDNEQLYFYLECFTTEQALQLAEEKAKETEEAAEKEGAEDKPAADAEQAEPPLAVPLLRIVYREDHDDSREAAARVQKLLEQVRRERQGQLLQTQGFPVASKAVAAIDIIDVATSAERSGSTIGKFLTALIIGFILTGGSIIASDTIAGEKERGTLETLLTTAVSRVDIVTAKQLAILIVALVVTVIQVVNLLVYVGFGVIPLPDDFAIQVSVGDALLILLLFVPAAALLANVLLVVSGRARSYKETQLYFLPIFLTGLLLSVAAVMPGIELRSAIVLLPIANTSVAVREVLVGTHDWLFLAISWLVTAAAAAWTARFTLAALSTERLITADDSDLLGASGQERFASEVLRWIAVIWAVLFISNQLPVMATSLVRQIVFNLVVLMGGGTWLMLRRYRLDVRQALALRAPRPAVWLAVLLGAPAGFLTAQGVFKLASYLFPVPEKVIERFAESLLPEELPIALLALLIVVMPGIFEEIFFRGMLLNGLHRRLRPVTLCLVVGVVFGLFHITLFRIIPVSVLGIALSAVTLLSGSIFPAMLWHAINNGLGLLIATQELPLDELGLWHYLGSAVVLIISIALIYRNRKPYPGLRH